MRKQILFILLAGCLAFHGQAQQQVKQSFWERVYFGGNLGLGFSSNSTYVDVSPQVGYKINDRLSAGIGVTYIYYKIKYPQYNFSYETSIYGGDIFSRYFFTESLFGHVETGALNLDVPAPFYPYTLSREWVQIGRAHV